MRENQFLQLWCISRSWCIRFWNERWIIKKDLLLMPERVLLYGTWLTYVECRMRAMVSILIFFFRFSLLMGQTVPCWTNFIACRVTFGDLCLRYLFEFVQTSEKFKKYVLCFVVVVLRWCFSSFDCCVLGCFVLFQHSAEHLKCRTTRSTRNYDGSHSPELTSTSLRVYTASWKLEIYVGPVFTWLIHHVSNLHYETCLFREGLIAQKLTGYIIQTSVTTMTLDTKIVHKFPTSFFATDTALHTN